MMTFNSNSSQAIASLRVFAISGGNRKIATLVFGLSLIAVAYDIVRHSSVFTSPGTNLVE